MLTLTNSHSLMEMFNLPLEQRTCKGRGQDVAGSKMDTRAYVSMPKRKYLAKKKSWGGMFEWYDASSK